MERGRTDEPISVLVADDEPAVRAVLGDLLSTAAELRVVGSAATTDETVQLARRELPDVVLLDVRMPPDGGASATRQILQDLPEVRVIGVSAYDDQSTVLEMLRAGAVGYVVKGTRHGQILDAVRRADRGEAAISIETLRALLAERKTDAERTPAANQGREVSAGALENDPVRRRQIRTLVRVQEEERRKIASDIHDDSLQIMAVASMRLGMLRDALTDPEQQRMVDQTRQSVQGAVARLRHLLFELRPRTLDLEGLVPAVRAYIEESLSDPGADFQLHDRLTAEPDPEVRAVVYRILQEALVNVRKHASARRVDVTLEDQEGGIRAEVVDDGCGFDTSIMDGLPTLGLLSMRERAEMADGWVRVTSAKGSGTRVEAWVPLLPD